MKQFIDPEIEIIEMCSEAIMEGNETSQEDPIY